MKHVLLIYSLVLVCSSYSYGQLKIYPLKHRHQPGKPTTKSNLKTTSESMELPFWDDFSQTNGTPSGSLWIYGQDVFINDGLAINPPSIKVASLDGAQGNGVPQSLNEAVDSLISNPLNLSSLTASDNVYLSFFYQYGGNGYAPQESDSLTVQFKNLNGGWESVWRGTQLDQINAFVQKFIHVDDSRFFHDSFQFRFQSYGNDQGPYSVWNIDYVYLNKDRSEGDNTYPDRTIVTPMTSVFGIYTAIPARLADISQITTSEIAATSLDRGNTPGEGDEQTFAVGLDLEIEKWNDSVRNNYSKNQIINNTDVLVRNSLTTIDVPALLENNDLNNADSIFLNYQLILDANDEEDEEAPGYTPISFNLNDTTYRTFTLKDYYAYDDGTAEVAAGLNASNTKLALKYYSPPDTTLDLNALDIYFPYINADPGGLPINIAVWEVAPDGSPGNQLYRESVTIITPDTLNKFIRYEFNSSVAVADSFFIGYEQNINSEIGVGLDVNTNTQDRVYFYSSSTWIRETTKTGSLMMRPVFGEEKENPITGTDNNLYQHIRPFPNPFTNVIYLDARAIAIRLYNNLGQQIPLTVRVNNGRKKITSLYLPGGLYIVKYNIGDNSFTQKIIKE